jgi:phosphatidylserine/phosphatidylglycerophosphate/cardiolipin synthase-like enzyme
MFTFTSAPIAQALIAAKSRGVAVEVLLDGTADGSEFSQRDPPCAAGVTARVEGWAGKLHDKYAVVDAGTASDPLILTGSTNWTNNAVTANDENLLIVHDADLAGAFADDFGRLRAAIGGAHSPAIPHRLRRRSRRSTCRCCSARPCRRPPGTPRSYRSTPLRRARWTRRC